MNTTNTFLRFHDNERDIDVYVSVDSILDGGTPIDGDDNDMELVTEILYKKVKTTFVPIK